MLIFERTKGERIRIAPSTEEVWITVFKIMPTKVKIGIEASPETGVDRQEVWEQKQKQS